MGEHDPGIQFDDDTMPAAGGAAQPGGATDSPLVIDESDRYGSLRLIPWWRQDRLQAARVLVVGAGALGNEVLKNLALVGIGTIWVIDRDRVEASNLARSVLFRAADTDRPKAQVAAERASELNPEITIEALEGDVLTDVGLGWFREADVVIGCLDNREARLWVNRQCWKANTPWVDAGIQEIQGVVKVFVPPHSACYECAMTRRDYELLNRRYSCPLLRREEILEGKVPTAPTIASMMGALEVQEALKLIHGLPVAAGAALVFNGVGNQFYRTELPRRDDCLSHETFPEPVVLPLGREATAAELLARASQHVAEPWRLALERDLVTAVECGRCGYRRPVMRPRTAVSAGTAVCPTCHEAARPILASEVEPGTELAGARLADLGIAAYDVVRVDGATESGFFLLAGDRPAGWTACRWGGA